MPLRDLFPEGQYIDPLGSWIEPDNTERWGYYADGFRDAAQLLLEQLNSDSGTRVLIDGLVYPTVFLYRHAVELYLKQLIILYSEFLEQPQKARIGHTLLDFWTLLKPLLREAYEKSGGNCGLDEENEKELSEALLFIHGNDRKSTAFRYPTDQKGNASLGDKRQFGLATFAKVADYAVAWLDGLGVALNEFRKQTVELQDEFELHSADLKIDEPDRSE